MSNQPATTNDPGQELAERAAALVQSQITAEDLVIPRLYIGQSVSSAVVNNHAPLGSLYLATDKDDPEPVVIYKPDQKTGVRVHLLAFEKVWAFTDDQGAYRVVGDYADNVPEEADRGYQLIFCVPEFDAELPVSTLFKRTAIPTAKRILTTVAKSKIAPWTSAFELTTAAKSSEKGHHWFIPPAAAIKPTPKHVAAAAALAALIGVGPRPTEIVAQSAEPNDDGAPGF